jgi:signal transduction histidine kinase
MSSPHVPLHRSLIVRLLATSVLVAVGAIAATAWLTAQTTTAAIEQQQGRSISDDALIYDTLMGYAATHASWDGVARTVESSGQKTGHRVTLLTLDRQVVADSAPTGPALGSAQPSATVDPLRVTTSTGEAGSPAGTIDARAVGLKRLTAAQVGGSIDPRAVGPYRLTAAERRRLDGYAQGALKCLSGNLNAGLVRRANGRPVVTLGGATETGCGAKDLAMPTATEARALRALTRRMDGCLHLKTSKYVWISPLFEVFSSGPVLPAGVDLTDIQKCLQSSLREQLTPYVAPPALLFVTDAKRGTTRPSISLTRKNVVRIAAGTGLVLVVAIATTVLVGLRLVRPLRRLTDSARRPIDEQERVPVGTRDEIGYLAIALNDLFDRRESLEMQRQAMVTDVAHELRTPLTNIRSWIEAAQDGFTPTNAQLLELLHDETVLLQHVVDDLRDLAAADAGTLRLYPEFRFLNDVLTQVVDAQRGVAETSGVNLSTDFSADPQLSIDPVRLRQLIGNLVSNAIRHTDPGGRVTIRTRTTDEDFVIEIVDTGTGIDRSDLEKVFDRFWRADASRSRATGGSGLGLAIVRKLAEAHDGTVTVASEVGVGSSFTVRLPRSRQAPDVAGG